MARPDRILPQTSDRGSQLGDALEEELHGTTERIGDRVEFAVADDRPERRVPVLGGARSGCVPRPDVEVGLVAEPVAGGRSEIAAHTRPGCEVDAEVEVFGPEPADGGLRIGNRGQRFVDGALAEEVPLAEELGRETVEREGSWGSPSSGVSPPTQNDGSGRKPMASHSPAIEFPATVTTSVVAVSARTSSPTTRSTNIEPPTRRTRSRCGPTGGVPNPPGSGTRSKSPS